MKQGEQQAKLILERKGIVFDETYYDDNSRPSMPDFKYLGEEHFLEVTHTLHNNAIVTHLNRFHQKSIDEQLVIEEKASEALDRMNHADYSDTPESRTQFRKDLQLLKSHFGYDPSKWNFAEQFSEFDCDSPIIVCSADNILREVQEKGGKYKSGDTDLFIFASEDEFESMMELLRSGPQNGCCVFFFNSILRSTFPVIYVCAWQWETQSYEIDNPLIMKFEKTNDGGMNARCI